MSDTPEPLSAILAEFRKFALRAAEEDKMISPENVLLLADKVEASAKQEAIDAELKWTRIGYDERKAEEKRSHGNAAATRKFDEAAFDEAVSKPNGWSDVDDPVAEIRRMRDGDAPGNAAALRKALNRVEHLANDLRNITERDTEVRADVNEIVDVCRTALAAPARNCDRFQTEEEAYAAFMGLFDHFKGERHYQYCRWLFAPA